MINLPRIPTFMAADPTLKHWFLCLRADGHSPSSVHAWDFTEHSHQRLPPHPDAPALEHIMIRLTHKPQESGTQPAVMNVFSASKRRGPDTTSIPGERPVLIVKTMIGIHNIHKEVPSEIIPDQYIAPDTTKSMLWCYIVASPGTMTSSENDIALRSRWQACMHIHPRCLVQVTPAGPCNTHTHTLHLAHPPSTHTQHDMCF